MTSEERGLRIHDYMGHMIEAVRLAQGYTVGLSRADFLIDRRTQQAVVLNLITIGEIAARVMSEHAEFAGKYPNVPWRQMRGMRNRLAHGYFDINLDIVWDTVQKSLPDLEHELAVICSQLADARQLVPPVSGKLSIRPQRAPDTTTAVRLPSRVTASAPRIRVYPPRRVFMRHAQDEIDESFQDTRPAWAPPDG